MKEVINVIRRSLNDFSPKFHFYTPLGTSENQRFAEVLRGYINETLG